MKAVHKYSKRISSTYTFTEMEVFIALGKQFSIKGWTAADWFHRKVEWDEEKQLVTVTVHYDEPIDEVSP